MGAWDQAMLPGRPSIMSSLDANAKTSLKTPAGVWGNSHDVALFTTSIAYF